MSRRYARSVSNERAVVSESAKRGINQSLVGAISPRGILTSMMVEGGIDGMAFKVFLDRFLKSHLSPGKIVILDNLPSHHVEGVRELIESQGATVMYLPPYSPEFNPIEECWSKIKSLLRKWKARTHGKLLEAVGKAIQSVTHEECRNWYTHAGYRFL